LNGSSFSSWTDRTEKQSLSLDVKDEMQGKPSGGSPAQGNAVPGDRGLTNGCRPYRVVKSTIRPTPQSAAGAAFVRKVTGICRGKASFTTPHSLGQYILMDYMRKKIQRVY
jgi:hypothetical protein